MATHSSTFALRIPWMEKPGGLQSMGLHRVGHDWATKHTSAWVQSYFSRVQLFATLWAIEARQAAPSMGFSRQEYWSVLPSPPGDLSNSGMELESFMFPASAGWFFTTSTTWEALPHNSYETSGNRNQNNNPDINQIVRFLTIHSYYVEKQELFFFPLISLSKGQNFSLSGKPQITFIWFSP